MTPTLLRLPFELRFQIWTIVLGPPAVEPCKCASNPGTCAFNHLGNCCKSFDVYEAFDNRLLAVSRQIYDEIRSLLSSSPKRYIVCNGLCLESFFLRIATQDRQWIKHVRVNVYVGGVTADSLEGHTSHELLRLAEASCGSFVQSALKCQGVGSLVHVAPIGGIQEDKRGRRILQVDLTLK